MSNSESIAFNIIVEAQETGRTKKNDAFFVAREGVLGFFDPKITMEVGRFGHIQSHQNLTPAEINA